MSARILRIYLGLAVWLTASATASAGFYIRDLGVLNNGGFSQGNAINASGTVAGTASLGVLQDRAVLGGNSGLTDLGSLSGGSTSAGFGINDQSLVTGDAQININGQIQTHAFRSQGAGALMDMGVLPGDVGTAGRGINLSGHVAGWSVSNNGSTRAFLAFAPKTLSLVTTLSDGQSKAYAVNNSDTVVGESVTVGGFTHAFRSSGRVATDLGGLPGSFSSSARAINNGNDVVGYSSDGGGSRAFLALSTGGSLIDIGVLPFGVSSFAFGINDSRRVVGEVDFASGDSTAFLWLPPTQSQPAQLLDLNNLIVPGSGWQLLSASAINNNTQIAGYGNLNGEIHGFRLDLIPGQNPSDPPAVPEPATAVLLVVGGLTLAAWRIPRRFRK